MARNLVRRRGIPFASADGASKGERLSRMWKTIMKIDDELKFLYVQFGAYVLLILVSIAVVILAKIL
jgi:hypothetical protein